MNNGTMAHLQVFHLCIERLVIKWPFKTHLRGIRKTNLEGLKGFFFFFYIINIVQKD